MKAYTKSRILPVFLSILLALPNIALAFEGIKASNPAALVISDRPGDYKISFGKSEGVEPGSKGVILRRGKEIAKFTVTSVERTYSVISIEELDPDAKIRLGDTAQITEKAPPSTEKKINKKDGAGKTLGFLALVGALIALGSSASGKNNSSTVSAGGGGLANNIILSADKLSLPADGMSTALITATVVDRNNAAVPDDTPVSFSTSSGTISPAIASTIGGKAEATLTAPISAGLGVVTASSGNKTATINITFIETSEGRPGTIELTASPTQIQVLDSIGGETVATITAVARDAQGNLASEGTMQFSSNIGLINGNVPINSSGVAIAEFRSAKTGRATIRASWRGAQAEINVTVLPGPPNLVNVETDKSAVECDGHNYATITAQILDIAGNPVTDGTVVEFSVRPDANGGGNGSITPISRTTNGQAVALLYSRSADGSTSNPGTATVVVTVPANQPGGIPAPQNSLVNDKTLIQFISMKAAVIDLLPYLVLASDEPPSWKIFCILYDGNNNPVRDGTAVYFTIDRDMIYGGSGVAGKVATSYTKSGIAEAIIVSASDTVTVTATCDNLTTSRVYDLP